jgi:dTDP-4-amino-4,6-dideoxygalactose transaminase
MEVPLLNLKLQYAQIKDEVKSAMDEVLESQQFIFGPKVESFEREIAQLVKVEHAIGVSSGTDALLLSLMGLGIGNGDVVITSPFTFFATASSISRVGATPLFVDIDPFTFTLAPDRVEETITSLSREKRKKLKAIMPVHLYGQCADMNALLPLARDYNLAIIEDAAQALGAQCPCGSDPGILRAAGGIGQYGCFSFFPTKNLGGFGEGGMVVTQEGKLAKKIHKLRHHGCKSQKEQYYYDEIGINGRLDALQAAVLSVKLNYLDQWTTKRRKNAENYDRLFKEAELVAAENEALSEEKPVKLPFVREGNYHVFHQYVIRAHNRDRLKAFLNRQGVGCGIYYPLPIHLQDCYRTLGYQVGSLPESEQASRDVLALPIFPELTLKQLETVVSTIKQFYKKD